MSVTDGDFRTYQEDGAILLRGAFRMLLDSADDITVVGEAADGREAVRLTQEDSYVLVT